MPQARHEALRRVVADVAGEAAAVEGDGRVGHGGVRIWWTVEAGRHAVVGRVLVRRAAGAAGAATRVGKSGCAVDAYGGRWRRVVAGGAL